MPAMPSSSWTRFDEQGLQTADVLVRHLGGGMALCLLLLELVLEDPAGEEVVADGVFGHPVGPRAVHLLVTAVDDPLRVLLDVLKVAPQAEPVSVVLVELDKLHRVQLRLDAVAIDVD